MADKKLKYFAEEIDSLLQKVEEGNVDVSVGVVPIEGGHRVTINEQIFDVMDGAVGPPGKAGSDATVTTASITSALGYTPAKQADVTQLSGEIDDYETLTLGTHSDGKIYLFKNGSPVGTGVEVGVNGDVVGYIDADNNIILTGAIAEDNYTVKYEMEDGTIIDIGTLTFVDEPDYTNILTSGKYTVELNKRWSASSKAYSTCNGMISLMIPKADVLNKTVRFKGFTKGLKASNQPPLWMLLDASNTRLGTLATSDSTGNLWNATNLIDEGDGVYGIEMNANNWASLSDSAAYFVLNMAVDASTAVTALDGLIMTIDEPIE